MKKNFVFGAADTVKSSVIAKMGELAYYVVNVPNFTNNVTAVVTFEDADGMVMYTSATFNRNSHNEVKEPTEIPVEDSWTMKVTLSGAPGGTGGTVVVALPGMDSPGW
jgi:hypothetical protein